MKAKVITKIWSCTNAKLPFIRIKGINRKATIVVIKVVQASANWLSKLQMIMIFFFWCCYWRTKKIKRLYRRKLLWRRRSFAVENCDIRKSLYFASKCVFGVKFDSLVKHQRHWSKEKWKLRCKLQQNKLKECLYNKKREQQQQQPSHRHSSCHTHWQKDKTDRRDRQKISKIAKKHRRKRRRKSNYLQSFSVRYGRECVEKV